MDHTPDGNGSSFWKGALGGFVIFGGWIFPAHISPSFWTGAVIKGCSAILIPFLSGIITLWATDWWHIALKNKWRKLYYKIFKPKNNGDKLDRDDEERVA